MNINLIEYFFPKETILIDFDFGNETFVNRFREYIDNDRGYFSDEFFNSKKKYLGRINSTEFVVRKKRKFMNLSISSSYAKGNISEYENSTSLEIELNGNDEFNALGKIAAHLFFLILFVVIILNGIYPLLILFIPFSVAFLAFVHFMQIRKTKKFKKNLMNILNELRN